MTTWIGADWDSVKCVVAVEAGSGTRIKHVKRTPESVRRFVTGCGDGGVEVGIEDGDPLWVGLWRVAGATVHVFDPQKAHSYAKSLRSSGASDDRSSARALLAMVQSPVHRAEAREDLPETLKGLEWLLSAQAGASDEVTRHANKLRQHLRRFHPALEDIIGKTNSQWLARLVEAVPTPACWVELDEEERRDVLRSSGVRAHRVKALEQVLPVQWVPLSRMQDTVARIQLRSCARMLQSALKEYAQLRRDLDAATQSEPSCAIARAVPGIGPAHAAAYAVAFGAGEGGRDSLGMRLGQSPVTNRSGKLGDKRPTVSMRRACRPVMRRSGSLIAVQLVCHQDWAAAAFKYYRAQGKTAFAAYRRIGRSFSRVMYACIRDGQIFDRDRYVQALKSKGVVWAAGLPALTK